MGYRLHKLVSYEGCLPHNFRRRDGIISNPSSPYLISNSYRAMAYLKKQARFRASQKGQQENNQHTLGS